jgi:cell division septation protein DedD
MADVPHLLAQPTRLAVAVLLAACLLLVGARPAAAHVEATVSPGAQAGAGPVTVAFAAEAESPSAGIASVKTQLPAGMPPQDVSLATGPSGWALTPTPDGFEVGGAPLQPGTDADFSVSIRQLPADRTELPLKTLVRYTDGTEDAWIEEPTPNNPDPENPAPIITVAPAAAPTSAAAPSPTPATSSAATSAPATTPQAQESDNEGTPTWLIVLGVLAAVAVLAGGLFLARRTRTRT